jgi:hypothetical protein
MKFLYWNTTQGYRQSCKLFFLNDFVSDNLGIFFLGVRSSPLCVVCIYRRWRSLRVWTLLGCLCLNVLNLLKKSFFIQLFCTTNIFYNFIANIILKSSMLQDMCDSTGQASTYIINR